MRIRVLLAVLVFVSPAWAQENRAAAEAMFDDGLKLFDQGKIADACPKFAASYKLDPASGTLLNLGRCYEKENKTASAWSAYKELIGVAHKEGNAKREATAKQLEEKIRPRLAKLTLTAPAGTMVKLDHVDLDPAQLRTAVPIDPGAHLVEASAPDKRPWTREVKIADAENASVEVPALEDAPPAAPPPAPLPSTPEPGLGPLKIAALASGGVGVVGLALGGVFGGIALSHASDARAHCLSPRPCDATGLSAREDARSSADLSTVALIAGGVFLAGGVVLWLVAPKSRGAGTTGGIFDAPIAARGISLRF